MDYLMDDLLKVFLGETTECLTACWAAVERLRRMPGDSAALGELLHQVRSVQETSKFLGMSGLQASASLVLESLESASARRPASTDRIVPIAVDGLLRIESVINAMANAEGEITPPAAPASRFANPIPVAGPTPSAAMATAVESIDSALTDGLPPLPAPGPDGTVRINAETLGYLVSTVRGLVDSQAEMMRLLQVKEAERAATDAVAPAAEKPKARQSSKAVSSPATARPAEPTAPPAAAPESVGLRPAQLLGAASPGMVRVLLFRGADGAPRAVYLDQVAGLEEVDLKAVDHNRGLWVMRSGSDLLPLVAVDPAGAMPDSGRAPVIVFTIGRQSFGLLVDSIPEMADVMPQDPAAGVNGSRGVVLLNGKAIEVIDPARYLDHAIRARVERRRPDHRKRRGVSDDHAAAPPVPDDLFVRKPAR
jgi:chemotaxis protein histidine kinase CheA